MDDSKQPALASRVLGIIALCSGGAAFLVPLQHAGPYGIPGRGLVGGILCFVIAAVLLLPSTPALARTAAMITSPFVLFLALYGALAELEEVVVLYAEDGTALRLWIVDHEEVEWISMRRSKSDENRLDGADLELLRAGTIRCVVPRLFEDAKANQRTFDLRQQKYAIQRMAVAVGLFDDGPGPETVTLRLDPCG